MRSKLTKQNKEIGNTNINKPAIRNITQYVTVSCEYLLRCQAEEKYSLDFSEPPWFLPLWISVWPGLPPSTRNGLFLQAIYQELMHPVRMNWYWCSLYSFPHFRLHLRTSIFKGIVRGNGRSFHSLKYIENEEKKNFLASQTCRDSWGSLKWPLWIRSFHLPDISA